MCNAVVPYERFLAKKIRKQALSILPENRPTLTIDLTGWFQELQKSIGELQEAMKDNDESEQ